MAVLAANFDEGYANKTEQDGIGIEVQRVGKVRSSEPSAIVALVSIRRPNFAESEVLKHALNPTFLRRASDVLIGRL